MSRQGLSEKRFKKEKRFKEEVSRQRVRLDKLDSQHVHIKSVATIRGQRERKGRRENIEAIGLDRALGLYVPKKIKNKKITPTSVCIVKCN